MISKIAIVTPIFKEGETDELGNYRPILVISSVARVFEKLIYYQLYEFLLNTMSWDTINGDLDLSTPLPWL